jgi:hypothetical protein
MSESVLMHGNKQKNEIASEQQKIWLPFFKFSTKVQFGFVGQKIELDLFFSMYL